MGYLKALLVEDDSIIRRKIKSYFEDTNEVTIIDEAVTISDFMHLFDQSKPDFLIIDIDLPDGNGVKLAENIRKIDTHIPIVFITGHEEFAAQSYLVDAADYIVKPIDPERIDISLEKIKRHLNRFDTTWNRIEDLLISPGKIAIKQESNIFFIETDHILKIEKEGKKTAVVVIDSKPSNPQIQKYYTRDSMKEVHERLDQNYFVRTHNSYIINLKWIHEVTRFSTEAYKIKFQYTDEYALLNRNKLNLIIQHMK